MDRGPEAALDDQDIIDAVRNSKLPTPSAIDTIDERRKHDVVDHEDAMLRLGQGCVSIFLRWTETDTFIVQVVHPWSVCKCQSAP